MMATGEAANEPPLDRSRDHVLEQRALERALALADDEALQARLRALSARRDTLMTRREAFNREATCRRHARGEIYSAARVAALNALGPSLEELEKNAQSLYGRHDSAVDVLKTHARVHFVNVLAMARLNLANFPDDIRAAARAMQGEEEAFASAWLAAIDDAGFGEEIRQAQREALRQLRSSTRPMFLAARPTSVEMADQDAIVLGKAWNRLDELAESLGAEPLSNFIAVPGEDDAAGLTPARIAASVEALCTALRRPANKLPGKKATLACLERLLVTLAAMEGDTARAWFEVDI